jgi:hypothetical protein
MPDMTPNMTEEEYRRLYMPPPPVESIPVILHQGRYRLYEKPDGTLRIQYQIDGKDTEDFMEIPGAMIKLAKAASEGKLNPMQMMKSAMEYMNGGGPGVSQSS